MITFFDYKSTSSLCFIILCSSYIFNSGLEKVHEDLSKYARDSLSSRLVAVISCESDSGAIDGINKDIMRLLELFWVSQSMASKDLKCDGNLHSWRTISLGPLCYAVC